LFLQIFPTVPPELDEWTRTESARSVAQLVVDKGRIAKLDYDDVEPGKGRFYLYSHENNVEAAKNLLQLHLRHQVELKHASTRKNALETSLEARKKELELGLRVEFAVPLEVLGMIIGKGGANIKRVQEESGVDRIIIDDKVVPPVVRIVGADAKKVR
jgi:hypothetical protein